MGVVLESHIVMLVCTPSDLSIQGVITITRTLATYRGHYKKWPIEPNYLSGHRLPQFYYGPERYLDSDGHYQGTHTHAPHTYWVIFDQLKHSRYKNSDVEIIAMIVFSEMYLQKKYS